MKIFHFGQQEFRLLRSTESDKVEFQKKIFARDVDVSQRACPQVIKSLQAQDEDTTACLLVEMDGYYTLWQEVKIPQPTATSSPHSEIHLGEKADVLSLNSRAIPGVSAQPFSAAASFSQPPISQDAQVDSTLKASDSQMMTASIAKVVQQVVEEALEKNTHIVPEHLVEALRTEIATLAANAPITLENLTDAIKTEFPNLKVAQQLAQKVLIDEANDSISLSLENRPEPSTEEQSFVKKQRQYRGVTYEISSEPSPEKPSDKKRRRYRGKPY